MVSVSCTRMGWSGQSLRTHSLKSRPVDRMQALSARC